MRATRHTLAALLLGVAGAGAAHGQAPATCDRALTVTECLSELLGEREAPRTRESELAAVEGDVREGVTKATAGAQTDFDLASALRDFVPRAGAALIMPGLSTDREALALRFNQPSPLGTFQVAVELPEPKLFGPLLEAVPEAQRDAVRERLEARLDDQDDVSGTLSLNAENRSLGRRFAPHAADITAAVQDILPVPPASEEEALDALTAIVAGIGQERSAGRLSDASECGTNVSPSELPLQCFQPAFAERVVATLRGTARALRERRARRAAVLESVRFSALPMLLNNQPQFNFSFAYRYRGDLVGPDELTGSLRLELGAANLNALRRSCRGRVTGACFATFLTDPHTTAALGRGRRFTARVDLSYRAEYDVRVPGETITVAEDRSLGLTGALALGQYFGGLAAGGTRRPRIDLQLDVEHQLDGELRNNRVVGRAAYTHPVSDQLGGLFGLVWANKPEYVGDVDPKVTARLGLTYKLVQPE